MPQLAIGAAIAAAAGTAAAAFTAGGFALIAGGALAYFAKSFVVYAVGGYILQELTGQDEGLGNASPARVRGSSRIQLETVVPKRWILGISRVRGFSIWYRHLDARLAYVQVISAGSMEAIRQVWINGEEVEVVRTQRADDPFVFEITPATGSRFNFTKSTTRVVERYEIVPIEGGGNGDGPPRRDPESPDGPDPGGGNPGQCGASAGSDACSGTAPGSLGCAPGTANNFAGDGNPVSSQSARSLPMFGQWWNDDIPLKDLLRWNPAVQGTAASAGAAEGGGVSGQQGEGGGNTPTQATIPPGYKRVVVRRKVTTTVTVPAFKITEYFLANGTQGSRIREIAAEAVPEGLSTRHNDLEWTTAHRLNGISYVLIELEQPPHEETVDGITNRLYRNIPDIEFSVQGLRIPTVQRNIPSQGATPILVESPQTLQWTNNAARLRYWFMRNRRQIPIELIDADYYVAAVERCDEQLSLLHNVGYVERYPATIRYYTIDGVLSADDRVEAAERQFDLCWNGKVVEWDGKFLFRPGAEPATGTPGQSDYNSGAKLVINPDDIIGHPIIRPSLPRENRINEVNVTLEQSIVDDYQSAEFTVADTVAQAKEGGAGAPIRLPATLPTLAFMNQPTQVINFMHQELRQQRASMEVDLTVMPGAVMPGNDFRFISLIPGDKIELNLPEYGIGQGMVGAEGASSIRYFRVLSNSVNPDLSVNLKLTQWPDNWFDNTIEFPPIAPRVNLIPDPVPSPVLDTSPNSEFSITYRDGQDGTVVWDAVITFEPSPHDIFVSAVSPLTTRQWARVTSDNTARFILQDPGTYTFNAWARRQSDLEISEPLVFTGVASYTEYVPQRGRAVSARQSGYTLNLGISDGV